MLYRTVQLIQEGRLAEVVDIGGLEFYRRHFEVENLSLMPMSLRIGQNTVFMKEKFNLKFCIFAANELLLQAPSYSTLINYNYRSF